MHTTESKWQDEPLGVAKELSYHAGKISTSESMSKTLMRAEATIRALVASLEQELSSNTMEPSE